MSKNNSYLSLKDWAIVICIASVIQLGLHFSFNVLKNKERPYNPILEYVKTESLDNPNSVLVFGSSLMGYGLECHESSVFQPMDGEPKLSIFKLWDTGDPFGDFFSYKYIDKILEIKPKVICIQTELAAVNLEWINVQKSLIKQISKENKDLKQLIFNPKIFPLNLDKHCYPKLDQSMLQTDTLNLSTLNRHIKPQDEIEDALNHLKRITNAGIKVVIIDIPRPYALESAFKNSEYLSALDKMITFYNTQLGIEYWPYTGKNLYFNSFQDRGHLNEEGRVYYSKWLKNQILTKVYQ